MRTGLILSVDRRNTLVEAEEVISLALKFRSKGVLGVDLCGDPAKGDVRIFEARWQKPWRTWLPPLHVPGSDVQFLVIHSKGLECFTHVFAEV
ncbi:hypothetical protein HDK64DRAFT_272412 [Phyllosticta capitalensis]